jgi:hypothetical protein
MSLGALLVAAVAAVAAVAPEGAGAGVVVVPAVVVVRGKKQKKNPRKSAKKTKMGGGDGLLLKLACAGLPSAGKSTMVNSLAGARLLETGVCRTTSARALGTSARDGTRARKRAGSARRKAFLYFFLSLFSFPFSFYFFRCVAFAL